MSPFTHFVPPFNPVSDLTSVLGGLGAGLAASLHCLAMCGPLACASLGPSTARSRLSARASYHLGRLVAYTLLGALAGAVGAPALAWAAPLRWVAPWLMLVFLLASALGAGRHLALPPALSRLAERGMRLSSGLSPTLRAGAIGAATPLLPCGLLYLVLGAAMVAGSAGRGAQVMGSFALGGAPALLAAQAHVGLWRWVPPRARPVLNMALPLLAAGVIGWRLVHGDGAHAGCHGAMP
jgi:sulfite exporter TauE/SafE